MVLRGDAEVWKLDGLGVGLLLLLLVDDKVEVEVRELRLVEVVELEDLVELRGRVLEDLDDTVAAWGETDDPDDNVDLLDEEVGRLDEDIG